MIEDASHAIGGSYFNEPVGNCRNSAITVWLLLKIITTGEGGVATTNNSELAQYMADLRSHGITKDSSRFLQQVLVLGATSNKYLDLIIE